MDAISENDGMSKVAQIAREIVAERARQHEHGYVKRQTPQDDDDYVDGELARAAAVLAAPESIYYHREERADTGEVGFAFRPVWPWGQRHGLDGASRRESLVKAAALIVAEIERIDRGGEA